MVGHSIRCRSTPYVYFCIATHSLSLFTRHIFWIHYTVVSIVAIICQKYNVLCENGGFSIHFAYAYLEFVDFVSITCALSLLASPPFIRADLFYSTLGKCRVALYGLFIFYGLTREELKGRRPLAKFLCIKLIVMFTFYQSFVVRILVIIA